MSRIRGKNTRPELLLRKALWHLGLRYRLATKLPGKPDIVFPRFATVVFIDGCFWHGCPKHVVWPRNNADFWKTKILGNMRRDKKTNDVLRGNGWLVIRVWEHEIHRNATRCALRLERKIRRKKPKRTNCD